MGNKPPPQPPHRHHLNDLNRQLADDHDIDASQRQTIQTPDDRRYSPNRNQPVPVNTPAIERFTASANGRRSVVWCGVAERGGETETAEDDRQPVARQVAQSPDAARTSFAGTSPTRSVFIVLYRHTIGWSRTNQPPLISVPSSTTLFRESAIFHQIWFVVSGRSSLKRQN